VAIVAVQSDPGRISACSCADETDVESYERPGVVLTGTIVEDRVKRPLPAEFGEAAAPLRGRSPSTFPSSPVGGAALGDESGDDSGDDEGPGTQTILLALAAGIGVGLVLVWRGKRLRLRR